uniref:Uncharacterized protein n=1 Tax=Romanomermis culicivorax TaxID=13658 RepID=A0A915HYG7_ROMCU
MDRTTGAMGCHTVWRGEVLSRVYTYPYAHAPPIFERAPQFAARKLNAQSCAALRVPEIGSHQANY